MSEYKALSTFLRSPRIPGRGDDNIIGWISLTKDMNGLRKIMRECLEERQESIDEEGCGPTLAGLAWTLTRKGRWKRRPLAIVVSYGGIDRSENPIWRNRFAGLD